jgi:2'-5' RNA ligase
MHAWMAVVAYPVLSAAADEWVTSIRTANDPQAGLLPAHFTLVFPAEASERAALEEVREAASAVSPFSFVLRSVRAARDAFGPGGHVFLIPDEGADVIVALHDRLYRGALAPSRRPDITFVPHITVGANEDWEQCQALADRLRQDFQPLTGRVEALDLLRLGDGKVKSAHRLPLVGTRTSR